MNEHQRWSIRRSNASDAEAIAAIRELPSTRRFQPIEPKTQAALGRLLDQRGSAPLVPSQSGKLQWTICESGNPIGWVALTVTSRDHHTGAVGYTMHPDHAGQGHATRAVREIVGIAFDPNQLGLERLEAVAAIDNHASRRVLEKSGFRCEGIATGLLIISGRRVDHARYELVRTSATGKDSQ